MKRTDTGAKVDRAVRKLVGIRGDAKPSLDEKFGQACMAEAALFMDLLKGGAVPRQLARFSRDEILRRFYAHAPAKDIPKHLAVCGPDGRRRLSA